MKRTRFAVEQITYALHQVESGTPAADVCRQLGCSEASFYIWKKRYGSMGITEVKELRQLRDENHAIEALSGPISHSTSTFCRRLFEKSSEADTTTIAGKLDASALPDRSDSVRVGSPGYRGRHGTNAALLKTSQRYGCAFVTSHIGAHARLSAHPRARSAASPQTASWVFRCRKRNRSDKCDGFNVPMITP